MGEVNSSLRREIEELKVACSASRATEEALAEEHRLALERVKKAISEYKKSTGFQLGLVRLGQVTYEFGYQVALARVRVKCLDLEVEPDPFIDLPEDRSFRMPDEVPFDDSLEVRANFVLYCLDRNVDTPLGMYCLEQNISMKALESSSSLRWDNTSKVAMEGLGRTLARKFCSNSLASWSKEEIEDRHNRLNHAHAGPLKAEELLGRNDRGSCSIFGGRKPWMFEQMPVAIQCRSRNPSIPKDREGLLTESEMGGGQLDPIAEPTVTTNESIGKGEDDAVDGTETTRVDVRHFLELYQSSWPVVSTHGLEKASPDYQSLDNNQLSIANLV
ncbi:unnamed protein product [Musa acuminata var. zebrina]